MPYLKLLDFCEPEWFSGVVIEVEDPPPAILRLDHKADCQCEGCKCQRLGLLNASDEEVHRYWRELGIEGNGVL